MQSTPCIHNDHAAIGIIMLDTVFPRIYGDIGNAETFSFPVIYKVVKGASPKRVVFDADPRLLQPFIHAAQELVEKGAKAISTSCGFLAIFHRELVNALDVPVYTSSLLQVHVAQAVIRADQKVGIITARKQSLTQKHLVGVGIQHYPLAIIGMEEAEEFSSVFIEGKPELDVKKCRGEMVEAALNLKTFHPDVGAIVLECTNMPPYTDAIRKAMGLPVFDVVTMLNYAHSTIDRYNLNNS
jgi:Asp/Glu/hydantoin racemase